MAGVQASDAASGHYLDPAIGSVLTQGATSAPGVTGGSAALSAAGTRAYLEVSAAAQGYGAEGVYGSGRSTEDSSPRIGRGSRDSSADRSPAAGNAPCGIMKVGSFRRFSLSTVLKVTLEESPTCTIQGDERRKRQSRCVIKCGARAPQQGWGGDRDLGSVPASSARRLPSPPKAVPRSEGAQRQFPTGDAGFVRGCEWI